MNANDSIAHSLREHLQLCQNVLALVEREHQTLRDPAVTEPARYDDERKDLLSHLMKSLNQIRQLRMEWTRLSLAERVRHPDVTVLLRQNQDVIMKIVMLDRDNEQALLRRGMLPSLHLPPSQRQRPFYVASLYQDPLPDGPGSDLCLLKESLSSKTT